MDYREIWNEICFHVKKNRSANELDFQKIVVLLFEKLGWSSSKGEIVEQHEVRIGSSNKVKPDIVIKGDGNIVLVVELKQANLSLSDTHAEQLTSYMRLLRLNYGVLLGGTLQIHSEVQSNSNSPVKICDISFENNSEIGIECIEMLSKQGFSFDRLDEFSKKCLANKEKYCEVRSAFNHNIVPRNNYQKPKSNYKSRNTVIPGFDTKYRPRRKLRDIPKAFKRTNEARDLIWWNGHLTHNNLLYELDGLSEKFVFTGSSIKGYELYIIIGVHESGRLKVDSVYLSYDENGHFVIGDIETIDESIYN
ncbi:MAG: type I restriction enzyme HsdR N-terminal domain-containing protein [Oscillospiraceae bacterium]|nr:type I restriction enzyme HsdR N-terminal domain-containing protein [Oscillospiraceae bacterium]